MRTKTLLYKEEYREDVIKMMTQNRLFHQKIKGLKQNSPSRAAILKNIKTKTKKDNNIRILIVDDQVAGMATLEVKTGMYSSKVKTGKLSNLYLLKKYRGKGLSKVFMSDLENEMKLKGCSKVKLSVYINNENAYHVYKKLGYTDVTIGMFKNL